MTAVVDADLYRAEIERLHNEVAELRAKYAEAMLALGHIAYELSPAVSGLPAERIGKVCHLLAEFQIAPNGGRS